MKTIIHSLQQNSSWSFGLVVAVALLTMTPLMHVQVAHAQYCDPSTDPFGCDGSSSGGSSSGYTDPYSNYGGSSSGYTDPYSNYGGSSSGYTDPYSSSGSGSGISWDNTWGNPYGVTSVGDPYNTVYDPSGVSNGYVDYGNCGTGCGSSYSNYNNYGNYGGYNYTTPTYTPPIFYQQPIYTPPTYYQPPVYQNPQTVNCPNGYTLQNGQCVPPISGCPNGYTLQNGQCVPPTVNCTNGYTLQNGACVPPTVNCTNGYTLQNGACVPPTGGCPSGYNLQNGACVPPIQPPVYQPPVYQPPVYQQPITYIPPAPQAPYVSLSQVPYTGLDLGPVGTVLYWTFLVLWCLICAYLIAVKRIQNKFVSWLKVFFFGTKKASTVVATNTASSAASVVVPVPDVPVDDFIFKQIHRARA